MNTAAGIATASLVAAIALAAPARTVHRSFSRGLPVSPSSSPNARNVMTDPSAGLGTVTRRQTTPPFDFFNRGHFNAGGIAAIGSYRHDVVFAANKAGAAAVNERQLPDGSLEMAITAKPGGIAMGRTGATGKAQVEYRAGNISVEFRNNRAVRVTFDFVADDVDLLARFRDWAKSVLDRNLGAVARHVDVLAGARTERPAAFGADPAEPAPAANEWKSRGIEYALCYFPSGPRRISVTARLASPPAQRSAPASPGKAAR